MRTIYYLDDLKHFINFIEINAKGEINFRGQSYDGDDFPDAIAEVRLLHNLANLLYVACYTRSGKLKQDDLIDRNEADLFLTAVREANTSIETYDCGWVVEGIEHGCNVLVRKGGNKRYTYAGDFLRENFTQGQLQPGDSVNIRIVPEYDLLPGTMEVFYFVVGETLLENNNSAIVRVYFNLMPDGVAPLVAWLSQTMNRYNIPFQFKCLNRPDLYTRCDAGVLYIDKRYFNFVSELLLGSYSIFKIRLKHQVPMFTRIIAPGIGFAENPFSPTESFGTSRCKIIAQGIVDAWKEKQSKDRWIDFILETIYANYLQPEALYLNPNSKYPYHFPDFEN